MTRVSDVAEFADAVPPAALCRWWPSRLLKGQASTNCWHARLYCSAIGPWGIGLLGFAPQALLDEQLAIGDPA